MTADENFESESDTEEPPFEKITFNTDYKIKTSLEEPPTDLQLKPLPDNLEYVFLEEPFFLPVIISSQLSEDKNKLVSVLKSRVPSNIASKAQQTTSSLKKVGTKKKLLGRKGVHTSQSTIPIEEGDSNAEHKLCIKYASDEDSASDCDTLVHLYVVVDWELLPTGLGSINAIYCNTPIFTI
ncbi:hypothetical protein Tco_0760067 [Tanacetum coccineum]